MSSGLRGTSLEVSVSFGLKGTSFIKQLRVRWFSFGVRSVRKAGGGSMDRHDNTARRQKQKREKA